MPEELWRRSATQLAALVADGDASARELVDAHLDRIDEVRNQWAFYRDRRPDTYDPLTRA